MTRLISRPVIGPFDGPNRSVSIGSPGRPNNPAVIGPFGAWLIGPFGAQFPVLIGPFGASVKMPIDVGRTGV